MANRYRGTSTAMTYAGWTWKRKPAREYLLKQGRFAHFTEEDLEYFQAKVDEMWEKWEVPGVIPFRGLVHQRGA